MGLGYIAEDIVNLVSGGPDTIASLDERIRELNTRLEELNQPPPEPDDSRPPMGSFRNSERVRTEFLLEAAQARRKALLDKEIAANGEFLGELQIIYGDSATQIQDLIAAMADLCTCLRDLATRIDSLAPLPSGGAAAPQADKLGFDGAGTGGGFIKASFSGGSPFGGNGLDLFNEQLQVAGLRAEDAGARVAELTERAGGARREFGALTRVLRANNVVFDDQVGAVRLLETLMPGLGAELTGVFAEAGTAGRDFDRVAEAMGGTLVTAFKGAAIEGKSFRRVMLGVIDDLLRLSQSAIGQSGGGSSIFGLLLNSAFGAIGDSLFGGGASTPPIPRRRPDFTPAPPLPFTMEAAKGAAFLRGRSLPEALAQGGVLHNSVVNHPTLFPMAKGYGLMGEAGPEAVMALAA